MGQLMHGGSLSTRYQSYDKGDHENGKFDEGTIGLF